MPAQYSNSEQVALNTDFNTNWRAIAESTLTATSTQSEMTSEGDKQDNGGSTNESGVSEDDCELSSAAEGGDRCSICLNEFTEQWIGIPDTCRHVFCMDCISEWSKNSCSCPIDRTEFSSLSAYDKISGVFQRKVPVTASLISEDDPLESVCCQIHESGDNEDALFPCDGFVFLSGFLLLTFLRNHCECLNPPLSELPLNWWFCPAYRDARGLAAVPQHSSRIRRALGRTRAVESVRAEVQESRIFRSPVGDIRLQIDEGIRSALHRSESWFREYFEQMPHVMTKRTQGSPRCPRESSGQRKGRRGTKKHARALAVSKKHCPSRLVRSDDTIVSPQFFLLGKEDQFEVYLARGTEGEPSHLLAQKLRQLSAATMRFNLPLPSMFTTGDEPEIVGRPFLEPNPELEQMIGQQEMFSLPNSRFHIQRNIISNRTLVHKKPEDCPSGKKNYTKSENRKVTKTAPTDSNGSTGPSSSQKKSPGEKTKVPNSGKRHDTFKTSGMSSSNSAGCNQTGQGRGNENAPGSSGLSVSKDNSQHRKSVESSAIDKYSRPKLARKIKIKRITNLPIKCSDKSEKKSEVYDPFNPTDEETAEPVQVNDKKNIYDPFEPTISDEERENSAMVGGLAVSPQVIKSCARPKPDNQASDLKKENESARNITKIDANKTKKKSSKFPHSGSVESVCSNEPCDIDIFADPEVPPTGTSKNIVDLRKPLPNEKSLECAAVDGHDKIVKTKCENHDFVEDRDSNNQENSKVTIGRDVTSIDEEPEIYHIQVAPSYKKKGRSFCPEQETPHSHRTKHSKAKDDSTTSRSSDKCKHGLSSLFKKKRQHHDEKPAETMHRKQQCSVSPRNAKHSKHKAKHKAKVHSSHSRERNLSKTRLESREQSKTPLRDASASWERKHSKVRHGRKDTSRTLSPDRQRSHGRRNKEKRFSRNRSITPQHGRNRLSEGRMDKTRCRSKDDPSSTDKKHHSHDRKRSDRSRSRSSSKETKKTKSKLRRSRDHTGRYSNEEDNSRTRYKAELKSSKQDYRSSSRTKEQTNRKKDKRKFKVESSPRKGDIPKEWNHDDKEIGRKKSRHFENKPPALDETSSIAKVLSSKMVKHLFLSETKRKKYSEVKSKTNGRKKPKHFENEPPALDEASSSIAEVLSPESGEYISLSETKRKKHSEVKSKSNGRKKSRHFENEPPALDEASSIAEVLSSESGGYLSLSETKHSEVKSRTNKRKKQKDIDCTDAESPLRAKYTKSRYRKKLKETAHKLDIPSPIPVEKGETKSDSKSKTKTRKYDKPEHEKESPLRLSRSPSPVPSRSKNKKRKHKKSDRDGAVVAVQHQRYKTKHIDDTGWETPGSESENPEVRHENNADVDLVLADTIHEGIKKRKKIRKDKLHSDVLVVSGKKELPATLTNAGDFSLPVGLAIHLASESEPYQMHASDSPKSIIPEDDEAYRLLEESLEDKHSAHNNSLSTPSLSPNSEKNVVFSQEIKETFSCAEEFVEQSRRRWKERRRTPSLSISNKNDSNSLSPLQLSNTIANHGDKNVADVKEEPVQDPDCHKMHSNEFPVELDIFAESPPVLRSFSPDAQISKEPLLSAVFSCSTEDNERHDDLVFSNREPRRLSWTADTDHRTATDSLEKVHDSEHRDKTRKLSSNPKSETTTTIHQQADRHVVAAQPIKTVSGVVHTDQHARRDSTGLFDDDLVFEALTSNTVIQVPMGEANDGSSSTSDIPTSIAYSIDLASNKQESANDMDFKGHSSPSTVISKIKSEEQCNSTENVQMAEAIPLIDDLDDAEKLELEKFAQTMDTVLNPTQILNSIGLNPQQKSAAQNAILSIAELSKHLNLDKIVKTVTEQNKKETIPAISPSPTDNIESSAVDMYNRGRQQGLVRKIKFQERIAEEAKIAIKPYYERHEISKTEYKEIMKRAVNKICSSESTMEVNTVKTRRLIRRYIEKYQLKKSLKKERMKSKLSNEVPKQTKEDSPLPPEYQPLSPPSQLHEFVVKPDELKFPVSTPNLLKRKPRRIITLPDLHLPPPPPPPPPPMPGFKR